MGESASGARAPEAPPANLADWRRAPQSAWAFANLRELVPSAEIAPPERPEPLETAWRDLSRLAVPDPAGTLARFLPESATTACVVMHRGRIVWEWFRTGYAGRSPHVVFSISKSLTGLVAGVLAARGLLDPAARLGPLMPELAGSAYADATIRDLLDMTVSVRFDESYLNADGDYARYRVATGWNPADPGTAPHLRGFLAELRRGDDPHGAAMRYVSPNSDLLGWVLERVSGRRFADLVSETVWQPIGAEAAAYVTLDRLGAARAAGGICARPRDLARLGEAVRRRGVVGGAQVLPAAWIDDLWTGGSRELWAAGDMRDLFEAATYRSQWYRTGLASDALAAIGIHGQWLWIDPSAEAVVLKLSAQPEPMDDALDQRTIAVLDAISAALGA